MIRLLIFLCLVGTGFYLLAPLLAQREQAVKVSTSDQIQDNLEAVRSPVSSWGSSLLSLRDETNAQQTAPSEASRPIPDRNRDMQAAQPKHANSSRSAEEPSPLVEEPRAPALADTEQDEWVKLTATVKARSEASVSALALRSYPAGSKAQVVGREGGWVQLLDPKTEARGWVYHVYLAPIDAAQTETASASPPVKAVSPTRRTRARAAKPAARTAKPTVRTANPAKVKKAKRPRRGLFKRRRAQRAWSVGPAR